MDNLVGRPEYTDEDFRRWLDDMAPFLKLGATINSAIEDASLTKHKVTIYNRVKLNDWFSEKIKAYQEYPGKIINYIIVRRVMAVDEKIRQGLPVGEDEMKDVRFAAEKHRSAQPYFVNRNETAQVEPNQIGYILDKLEAENINNVALEAKKAMEAIKPTTL